MLGGRLVKEHPAFNISTLYLEYQWAELIYQFMRCYYLNLVINICILKMRKTAVSALFLVFIFISGFYAQEICISNNLRNGYCTDCAEGFRLIDNACVKTETESKIVVDPQTNVSKNVTTNKTTTITRKIQTTPNNIAFNIPNCASYQGNECIECQKGYNRRQGGCYINIIGCRRLTQNISRCENCQQYFELKDGKCWDPNCEEYSQYTDLCFKCKDEYQWNNLRQACLDRNCMKFSNGGCEQCQPGYYLSSKNSMCIQKSEQNCQDQPSQSCDTCPENTFETLDNGCSPFIPGCATHSINDGRCLRCYTGLRLEGSSCIDDRCSAGEFPCQNCKDGFKKNENDVCIDEHCQDYDEHVCILCAAGWEEIDGSCSRKKLERCNDTNDSGECVSCISGYNLVNGYCRLVSIPNCQKRVEGDYGKCEICATEYYVNSQKKCSMVPYNCLKFDETTQQCSQCRGGIAVNSGKCIDPNCLQQGLQRCDRCKENFKYLHRKRVCVYEDPNCQQYDNQLNCLRCQEDYELGDDMKCHMKPEKDPKANCQEFNNVNNYCQKCDKGYFTHNSGCKAVSSKCAPERYNFNTGACTSCIQGYKLSNGVCADPHCLDLEVHNGCKKCKDRYMYDQEKGYCIFQDLNCETVTDQKCQKCKQGYDLNEKGLCYEIPRHCTQFSGEKCSRCKDGYILRGGLCYLDTFGCRSYDPKTQRCLQCSNGFVELGTGACKDRHCLVYQGNECLRCMRGFEKHQNKKQCFDRNCEKLYQQHDCEKCRENYFLRDELCVELDVNNCARNPHPQCTNCPTSHYYRINFGCERKVNGCDQQNNETCSRCLPGLKFKNNTCVNENCLIENQFPCRGGCKQGYELNDKNVCVDPNCQSYTAEICRSCRDGFALLDNRCLKTIQNCEQLDRDGSCIKCKGNLQSINNVCSIPDCLKRNQNDLFKCDSCKDGYYINNNGFCSKVPYLCKNYNETVQYCQQCIDEAFNAVNGCRDLNCQTQAIEKCQKCHQNYKYNEKSRLCRYDDPNCHSFNDIGKCTNCKQGFRFNSSNICISVLSNCKNKENNIKCRDCDEGYRLVDHSCYENIQNCQRYDGLLCKDCSKGYYLNEQKSKCPKIPANCQNVNPQGTCTKCINTHYLKNGICIERPDIANCKTADTNNPENCIICDIGYFLTDQKQCQQIDILFCGEVDENDSEKCVKCVEGYRVSQGKCIKPSQRCVNSFYDEKAKNYKCTECKIDYELDENQGICYDPYCLKKSHEACKQCKEPYRPNKQGKCTLQDPNCEIQGENQCLRCRANFYLEEGICYRFPAFCAIPKEMGRGCNRCLSGYRLINNRCYSRYQPTACKEYFPGSNDCKQCNDRYYLDEGFCISIPVSCSKYNKQNGDCTQCLNSFNLDNGKCVAKQLEDSQCQRRFEGGCIECKFRHYIGKEGLCIQVKQVCKTFNKMGQCTSCFERYQLVDNDCKSTDNLDQYCKEPIDSNICGICYNRYYVKNGRCTSVDPLCREYHLENGHCTACYEQYELIDGKCILKEEAVKNDSVENKSESGCKLLEGQVCKQCHTNYNLYNERCWQIPAQCKLFDLSRNVCTECHEGYIENEHRCVQK